MSKTFMAAFEARGVSYEHKSGCGTDETYIINGTTGATIYTVNSGGWVYNRYGALTGRFRTARGGCWHYEAIDTSIRMNTLHKELPKAERDVFRRLISLGYLE